jgi:hypothetical protein
LPWAVGERSSVWRIWANSHTSDIYVAARTIAGDQKYSLHETGDFVTHGLPSTTRRESSINGAEARPTPSAGPRRFSIWVRSEDVTPIDPDDTRASDVTWIPKPPPGLATGIYVVLVTPDPGWAEVENWIPMHVIGLPASRLTRGNVSHRLLASDGWRRPSWGVPSC